ncbi:MAG: hypothetical protein WCT52_04790 [Candidatus Micrarchaeia archaeon]
MEIDERKVAIAAAIAAVAGILLLFFLAETPRESSVAESLIAAPNTLLEITGEAANITTDRFQLCDRVCISVKGMGLPSSGLLSGGERAVVLGRVKEYMGRRYVEAEKITLE